MELAPRHSTKHPINSPPFPLPTPLIKPISLPFSLSISLSSFSATVQPAGAESTCEHGGAAAMERPAHTAARQGAAAAQALRQLPPGFRFHPTDEELVVQYLRRKALSRPLPAAVIPVVDDVARLDPWDLPGASEGEGYFFSLRRAPATGRGGGCRRREAGSGYWKATGKATPVFLEQGSGCGGGGKRHLVGVKTTLAFHYRGEPSPSSSSSSRTAWVMNEYRLAVPEQSKNASHGRRVAQPGEWVVCRIFLKSRPRRRNRDAVDSQVAPPLQHQGDAGHLRPSPSPSSSSCVTGVTDISDQEEVSSDSSIAWEVLHLPPKESLPKHAACWLLNF